jgi:two-component system sensor histidine kinase CpxA
VRFANEEIVVGASSSGERVVLWVVDDGPGMDAGDLERVFEPFYRSPRSAARTGGSGLGLAIVNELVLAMDGTVTAATDKEGGCRVTVTLRPWKTTS